MGFETGVSRYEVKQNKWGSSSSLSIYSCFLHSKPFLSIYNLSGPDLSPGERAVNRTVKGPYSQKAYMIIVGKTIHKPTSNYEKV